MSWRRPGHCRAARETPVSRIAAVKLAELALRVFAVSGIVLAIVGCAASEVPESAELEPRSPVEAATAVDRAVATTGDVITSHAKDSKRRF